MSSRIDNLRVPLTAHLKLYFFIEKLQLCTCEDNKFPSLSWPDIKAEDWSQYVAPFWPAVIRSALTWNGLTSLLRSGKLDNSRHKIYKNIFHNSIIHKL